MLGIVRDTHEGFVEYRLSGSFDGVGSAAFDQALSVDIDAMQDIVLDFSDVTFLSSAGIRSLLKAEKRLRVDKAGLLMLGVSPSIHHVFEISGLVSQFRFFETLEEIIRLHDVAGKVEDIVRFDNRIYIIQPVSGDAATFDLWDPSSGGCSPIRATLTELEMAVGRGGFEGDEGVTGDFMQLHGFFGVASARENTPSDFILTNQPDKQDVMLESAVGISGQPWFRVRSYEPSPTDLGHIIGDLRTIALNRFGETHGWIGVAGLIASDESTGTDETSEQAILLVGFIPLTNPPGNDTICRLSGLCAPQGIRFMGVGLRQSPVFDSPDLDDNLRHCLHLENIGTVRHIDISQPLSSAKIWVFLPGKIRSCHEKRLRIEWPEDVKPHPEWDNIVRKLYREESRVVMTKLAGGFTSLTFAVTGYDRDGRRILPTVLKLANHAITRAEEESYHRYVKRFILNNGTSVLGSYYDATVAGISINFVGIDGPDSKIRQLTSVYLHESFDKYLTLLDKVFTDVLKPWYGQPRWEPLTLWKMHDPHKLFEGVDKAAMDFLGADYHKDYIDCPQLGMRLPNPYRYLAEEYPRLREKTTGWYSSVIHGDLNLQNILLDERDNVYVIDFSETRIGNVVSDFARLEPVLKCEFPCLSNEKALAEMLEFDYALQQVSRIDEKPEYVYRGTDPQVRKAYETILRLRSYADRATIFETAMLPWFLAVLEWTLPIVCYWSVDDHVKRFAVYSGGIIVKRILELGHGPGEKING